MFSITTLYRATVCRSWRYAVSLLTTHRSRLFTRLALCSVSAFAKIYRNFSCWGIGWCRFWSWFEIQIFNLVCYFRVVIQKFYDDQRCLQCAGVLGKWDSRKPTVCDRFSEVKIGKFWTMASNSFYLLSRWSNLDAVSVPCRRSFMRQFEVAKIIGIWLFKYDSGKFELQQNSYTYFLSKIRKHSTFSVALSRSTNFKNQNDHYGGLLIEMILKN